MKTCLSILFFVATASAENISIEFKNAYNGYATVAGTVTGDTEGPFLVTVENAGLRYSTVSDNKGKFGIVFRFASTKFDVTANALNQLKPETWSVTDTLSAEGSAMGVVPLHRQ